MYCNRLCQVCNSQLGNYYGCNLMTVHKSLKIEAWDGKYADCYFTLESMFKLGLWETINGACKDMEKSCRGC